MDLSVDVKVLQVKATEVLSGKMSKKQLKTVKKNLAREEAMKDVIIA